MIQEILFDFNLRLIFVMILFYKSRDKGLKMTKNQLNLVRVLIEHVSIVEIDYVKDGAYNYDDIDYSKIFSEREFEEVRDYLIILVANMPIDLDI